MFTCPSHSTHAPTHLKKHEQLSGPREQATFRSRTRKQLSLVRACYFGSLKGLKVSSGTAEWYRIEVQVLLNGIEEKLFWY